MNALRKDVFLNLLFKLGEKMITSLKIANVIHLAALKFAAAKSVVGVGVVMAASATGMIVTEQVEPDYIDAAVVLINQTIDAETGLSTQALTGEYALPTARLHN